VKATSSTVPHFHITRATALAVRVTLDIRHDRSDRFQEKAEGTSMPI